MRYILLEKIATQPKNFKNWLEKRITLLDSIISQVEQATEILAKNEHDGDYILSYALRSANDGVRVQLPSAYSIDLDRHYQLTRLRDSLQSIVNYGANRFLTYAVSSLNDINQLSDETKHVLAMMPHAKSGFVDYGFAPGTPDTENDPEYAAANAMLAAYLKITDALKKTELVVDQLKPVLLDLQRRYAYNHTPEKYRPEHGDVETLYHASLYAVDIVAHGFAAEKPSDREGVGNYGDQPEISFTHSLPIAHDIMRALKEMWMIVHKKLSSQQIIGWMNSENIDLNKAKSVFLKSGEPLSTIPQTIRLYRSYLGFSKIRTDPVFTDPERLIPQLEKIDINDIGIVSCEVRLTGDEKYLHGEAEFRVPASAVIGKIKRVI
jgi:hypothetical protein